MSRNIVHAELSEEVLSEGSAHREIDRQVSIHLLRVLANPVDVGKSKCLALENSVVMTAKAYSYTEWVFTKQHLKHSFK